VADSDKVVTTPKLCRREGCTKPVAPRKGGPGRRPDYCSEDCRRAAVNARKRVPKAQRKTVPLPVRSPNSRPQARKYDVPEDVRVLVRSYKAKKRRGEEVTEAEREALKAYERIRWEQISPEQRQLASERSNASRSARATSWPKWVRVQAALTVAERHADEWEAEQARIAEEGGRAWAAS
jgi:hypothetical protein